MNPTIDSPGSLGSDDVDLNCRIESLDRQRNDSALIRRSFWRTARSGIKTWGLRMVATSGEGVSTVSPTYNRKKFTGQSDIERIASATIKDAHNDNANIKVTIPVTISQQIGRGVPVTLKLDDDLLFELEHSTKEDGNAATGNLRPSMWSNSALTAYDVKLPIDGAIITFDDEKVAIKRDICF